MAAGQVLFIGSDRGVVFAYWAAIIIIVAALLVIITVIYKRRKHLRRQRVETEFIEKWQTLFARVLSGRKTDLPAIPGQFELLFLKLWYHSRETVRGIAAQRLEQLAHKLEIHSTAADLFDREKRVDIQLICIGILGHLRFNQHCEKLNQVLHARNQMLSLSAARALLKIAPEEYIDDVLMEIMARPDWPRDRVAGLMLEVEPRMFFDRVPHLENEITPEQKVLLMRLVTLVEPARAVQILEESLEVNQSPEAIATALSVGSVIGHPGLVKYARRYIEHQAYFVRVQAVNMLGTLGNAEDRDRLVARLGDTRWWVRYRAGQSLLKIPDVELEDLKKLSDEHTDQFAREILKQVIAEESLL